MADGGAASQDESSAPGNDYSILHIHTRIQTALLTVDNEQKSRWNAAGPRWRLRRSAFWVGHGRSLTQRGGNELLQCDGKIHGNMPPPFVWLDGCTPLHIHTSADKHNLAYFISNCRRDSGSCATRRNAFSEGCWVEMRMLAGLARRLALGFVLMHTGAFWERFAYSYFTGWAVAALAFVFF